MKNDNSNRILEGPIASSVILFALPIAFSSLLQQLFNAADQAVVGQFAGSTALAAVGANTTIVSLMVGVFTSISIGSNALIARRIGEQREDKISKVVHTSITFAGVAGILLLILGQIIASPLLTLMGTPDNVLDQAVVYLRLYALGFPFALLYNFGSAILRSTGDTKRPMYALIAAGILNVILNLCFVLGLHMGVAGVACATAISNVLSCSLVMSFLIREKGYLKLSPGKLGIDWSCLGQILQIGGPAALQSAVFNVANICIQSGINSLGSDAVAGNTCESTFEYISYFITNAFGQAATTFCGQNYGAGQKERCRKVMLTTIGIDMLFAGCFDEICLLARVPLVACFTSEPGVAHFAYQRIFCTLSVHFLIALYEILGAALRSMGYSLVPALLTIVGSVAFRVLWLVTVFAAFPQYPVLMLVYPASWILTAILTWGYYFSIREKLFGKKGAVLS